MTLFFCLMMTTTFTAMSVVLFASVVMQAPQLKPATFPFAPGSSDPSADTLVNQAQIETVFADQDWQSLTLNSLSHVENLLDHLEAHNIEHREVITLGNAAFCVRWR